MLFSESGYLRPSTECGSITQHPSGIYITRSSSAKYSNLDNLPSLIATHGLSCSDVQNLNLTCLKCPFLPSPRSTKFTKPRLNHLKAGIDGKAAIDLGYQNDTGDREGTDSSSGKQLARSSNSPRNCGSATRERGTKWKRRAQSSSQVTTQQAHSSTHK
jgi:hypothetical protein